MIKDPRKWCPFIFLLIFPSVWMNSEETGVLNLGLREDNVLRITHGIIRLKLERGSLLPLKYPVWKCKVEIYSGQCLGLFSWRVFQCGGLLRAPVIEQPWKEMGRWVATVRSKKPPVCIGLLQMVTELNVCRVLFAPLLPLPWLSLPKLVAIKVSSNSRPGSRYKNSDISKWGGQGLAYGQELRKFQRPAFKVEGAILPSPGIARPVGCGAGARTTHPPAAKEHLFP